MRIPPFKLTTDHGQTCSSRGGTGWKGSERPRQSESCREARATGPAPHDLAILAVDSESRRTMRSRTRTSTTGKAPREPKPASLAALTETSLIPSCPSMASLVYVLLSWGLGIRKSFVNATMPVGSRPWLGGGQRSRPLAVGSGGDTPRAKALLPKVSSRPSGFLWLTFAAILAASTGLRANDFAEGNASMWGTFASDNAATSVSNDVTQVKAGAYSLRFDTGSGFDTGVVYPGTGAAHWNAATNTHVAFWHYGVDTNEPTWQGNQPVVVLQCAGGSLHYEPQRQFTYDRAWSYARVPLAGDAMWQVTPNGTPTLADVLSLEIHQDTWGYGFTVYYDAVQFVTLTGDLRSEERRVGKECRSRGAP